MVGVQVGWRRFCAWLLQTTRALNRGADWKPPAPPPTDSLLETVAQLREGGLTASLFDGQVPFTSFPSSLMRPLPSSTQRIPSGNTAAVTICLPAA